MLSYDRSQSESASGGSDRDLLRYELIRLATDSGPLADLEGFDADEPGERSGRPHENQ